MAKKSQDVVGDSKDDGKKQALNLALSQITKQFGDGSIMKLGEQSKIDVELFSSGSLALDLALGGGLELHFTNSLSFLASSVLSMKPVKFFAPLP